MRRCAAAEVRSLVAAGVLLLAACGRSGPRATLPAPESRAALDADAAAARAVAAAFITAEAAGDAAADTLLAAEADFVSGGVRVATRPRLSGLTGTGTGVVESASIWIAGAVAWVVLAYRFEAASPGLDDRGRATLVLERQRAGWRIRHVHSSSVERW
jgi:hypothetical protein